MSRPARSRQPGHSCPSNRLRGSPTRRPFARALSASGARSATIPLAVGSAKELIESTAKVVLSERGQLFDDKADLPKLARAAQLSLGLDPSTGSGPDGSDGVKRILGAVTTIANGFAELRNRGLGTGHGPATARVGLGTRHAHLAVNAALTWCQLMLDTLADPEAPWRKGHS